MLHNNHTSQGRIDDDTHYFCSRVRRSAGVAVRHTSVLGSRWAAVPGDSKSAGQRCGQCLCSSVLHLLCCLNTA